MMAIMEGNRGESAKIQHIHTMIKKEERVHSILMYNISSKNGDTNSETAKQRQQNLNDAEAFGEWVTRWAVTLKISGRRRQPKNRAK